MKHRVYYDSGGGVAALLTAAIRLQKLPGDVLPDADHVASFLRDHGNKAHPQGTVYLMGEERGERIYWCGLGGVTHIAVRTWRHFLHLYQLPQSDFSFCYVPKPSCRRWRRGEKLLKQGRREESRKWFAGAAVQEYAVFLTVLMSDWRGE
ncbi:hypothetical protein CIG75_09390 [Tumebacillus algifaecis]|uniref:Uncharacterized protein n=1 Tax=Tumebacillus algifaecis TaxID=1214604 RepID=A0A223D1C7_9BACL|nr:DUF3189 family protein [Tumebacillus algifaecis]ASS75174.1 hypothetical protein CIG75_09390 [Tumebacillus algifaecis]